MMKHLLKRPLWLFMLFVSFGIMAQDPLSFTIQGNVTDTNDEPLVGATVQLVGSSLGTVTDVNGDYQLTFTRKPGTYQLAYNFVGHERVTEAVELNANNPQLTVDKALALDLIGLSEVVVTGTSVATSKKQLGNAISTVSGEKVSEVGAIAIDQALAGKVAGALVQQNSGSPAGGISIRLRGVSTLAGSSDPLYIVDGVIISNSSSQLVDLG